jgi:hypothetical protein
MQEEGVKDKILQKAKEIFNDTCFLEIIQVVEDVSAADDVNFWSWVLQP